MPSNRRFAKLVSAAMIGCLLAGPAVLVAQTAEEQAKQQAAAAAAAEQAAVAAQVQADAANPAPGLDPNSFYGKESTEGVYVRDSALALEKFALAQRMERLKEWNKSADLYQEVIEKYPDRVVPSRTNDDDKIVQYTSVTRGVMERLARWPKEGLDVYRARFEPTAAGLVEAAGGAGARGDLAEMHRVFYRYFITETAKKVGLRLVDVNLERGEFQSAARLADELLNWHPGLSGERPAVLYRAALAHRLAGDEAKAAERLAALRKGHADATGTVRGKEVKLAESLAQELKVVKPLGDGAVASADSWTTLGGDASRARISPARGRPGARLFKVPLTRPNWRNLTAPSRNQIEQENASMAASGLTTGVFPVVDRGELFFQDGTRVYARSLESGLALPGWAQTYPGNDEYAGTYALPGAVGNPRTHQLTLTLTDRAVLGIMGQPDRSLYAAGVAPAGEPRLVCLDRQTGKENWAVTLGALDLPGDVPDDQQKSVRGLRMNGSPLVVGDSVLIAARGVKQAQFEDCWVVSLSLATGKYRWSCYVASASTVGAPWATQGQGVENSSHLAYANGRVYVMSNLGALAALDAYSGTIVWLDIYERGAANPFDPNQPFNPFMNQRRGGRGGPFQQAVVKPWLHNPVLVKDGHVFVLPAEGRNVYVYDANTGAEVRQIRRADFGNADLLLAVLGERLVLGGDKKLYCVDWRKYDPENAEASLLWSSVEFQSGLRGRPFVTADSVFVTDESRLSRIDLKGGRVMETYPRDWKKTWDEKEEGPGNVLVTAEHVMIAGATHVYGYTDLTLARARLDREVAAAPDDAAPRLGYAEIMFSAGEPATAMGKLDEAIKLLGGMGAMRAGPSRDRVFSDAMQFAQKLGGDERPEIAKLAGALYDRAAAAASTAPQKVHYRLSRARYADAAKDPAAAARLYQEILSEPDLRPVPLVDATSGGPTQAAAVAENAIRDLVARAGAAVYAPFEQAAGKRLAEAKAAAPPEPRQFLDVAHVYPNAAVAPQALLAAADAYETAGSPRTAVQVLRQMYFKYPDTPDKARILESMARNYLGLPNRAEVAAARLAQGASLPGEPKLTKPLKLPGGPEIAAGQTFAQALEEVRKLSGEAASKNLPDFGLPVPPRYQQEAALRRGNARWPFPAAGKEPVTEGVAALALPLREFARPDRVVAWSSTAQLAVYQPGEAKPLGTSGALAEVPKGSAWVGGDGVVVWSASAVALVPERGGDATWRLELKDLPAVEVVRAGGVAEAAPADPQAAGLDANGLVARRMQLQRRQQLQMRDGVVRPVMPMLPGMQNRPDPAAPEQVVEVRPVGDRVLVATTTGRLLSLDATTGRLAWQTRLSDRPADRIAANEDFTVLKVSDEGTVRLVAMDTFTGQIRGTKAFAVQTGQFPLNIALSADGTLVYTLPDKMVLKDLYKPWDASDRDITGGGAPGVPGVPPYANATGPDQLLVAEGRILALAEVGIQQPISGNNKKFVRVHSLETGQPITLKVPHNGSMVDLQLSTETDTWDVKLRVIGPRLYILNPRTVVCYNLDRPEDFWKGQMEDFEESTVPNVREAYFGQQHVVLLSNPGVPEPRPGVHQLLAYARYPGKPGDPAESGRLDYDPTIVEPRPITHWQGVEGGFYYLTADGKLHFLSSGR